MASSSRSKKKLDGVKVNGFQKFSVSRENAPNELQLMNAVAGSGLGPLWFLSTAAQLKIQAVFKPADTEG